MLCRQLDKNCEKDFFCVDGLVRKDIQGRRPEKIRTEKLNRIAKKLRRVSKVQTLEQNCTAL